MGGESSNLLVGRSTHKLAELRHSSAKSHEVSRMPFLDRPALESVGQPAIKKNICMAVTKVFINRHDTKQCNNRLASGQLMLYRSSQSATNDTAPRRQGESLSIRTAPHDASEAANNTKRV